MSFDIKNDEMLEKYNKTWGKVCNTIENNLIVNLFLKKMFEN